VKDGDERRRVGGWVLARDGKYIYSESLIGGVGFEILAKDVGFSGAFGKTSANRGWKP
jgi:hypothetical protein